MPVQKASNPSDQNCFTYRGIEYRLCPATTWTDRGVFICVECDLETNQQRS